MEALFEQQFTKKSFLKFISPAVISMVFLSLYTIIDGIFVSNVVGSDALAAINIILPVMSIIWGVGIMIGAGGSAIIGYKMGEGKHTEANRIFSLLVAFGAVIGLVVALIGGIFIEDISRMMGANERLMEYCIIYGFIMLVTAPLSIIKSTLEYFVRTDGDMNYSLYISIVGGVINIILDYVFIVQLEMGIAGAAWATVAGIVASMILGIVYFFRKRAKLRFTKPKWQPVILKETTINGSSELVTQISGGITTFLFNMAIMKFAGADGVAALTIVLYAQYLLVSVYLGFSVGVAPILSYAYGSENYEQIKTILKYSLEILIISAIIVFLIAFLGGDYIVQGFIDKESNVYELAAYGMNVFSFGFLVMGFNIFASGMFTAFSNGKISAIISFARAFVFVIIGLVILASLFQINGVWLTIPVAEALTLILSIFYVLKYKTTYHYGK